MILVVIPLSVEDINLLIHSVRKPLSCIIPGSTPNIGQVNWIQSKEYEEMTFIILIDQTEVARTQISCYDFAMALSTLKNGSCPSVSKKNFTLSLCEPIEIKVSSRKRKKE